MCLCGLLCSALHEAQQRHDDGSVVDGHDMMASLGGGTEENPFGRRINLQELLDQQSLDMYQDLLNRPLPRLPKLYTLPSRFMSD